MDIEEDESRADYNSDIDTHVDYMNQSSDHDGSDNMESSSSPSLHSNPNVVEGYF